MTMTLLIKLLENYFIFGALSTDAVHQKLACNVVQSEQWPGKSSCGYLSSPSVCGCAGQAGLAHQVLLLHHSISYLSRRCHAHLMSQFWSRNIPAAIWEGSGPKNI